MVQKITVPYCIDAKRNGKKLTMLTAYDYPIAKLLDDAEIDILLVGDSLGMVIQGRQDTLAVTMDDMVYHTRLVSRAVKRALVIGDMPLMSFQNTVEEAVVNAGRLIKEGRAHAVKLEGGREVTPQIKAIVNAGIPVMGHIGLTPQSVHQFGGYKVQGKSEYAIKLLIADAKSLENAGAFSIVLEGIPPVASKRITEAVNIPTIGIGAGIHVDGQVLVTYDMLGFSDFAPKFVKRYKDIKKDIIDAVKVYAEEVSNGEFPTEEYSYNIEIEDREEPDVHDQTKSFKKPEYDEFDTLF